MRRYPALFDEMIYPVQSEKADEDTIDGHCELHDARRNQQEYPRDHGANREQVLSKHRVHPRGFEAPLFEFDADPELFSPNILTGQTQSIVRHDQYEALRDAGLVTSIAAPVVERSRTTQSTAPPTNLIVPAFETR